MSYINHLKFTQAIFEQRPLDSKELLSDIRRDLIIKSLQRSKDGLPRAIQFTNAPIEEENLAKMPRRDKKRLWKLYEQIQENPQAVLPKLFELQTQYPDVPAIANYLSLAYRYNHQEELYLSTLLETYERFPDYLFGKTALAEYYLNQQEHRQVSNIFDRKFEIWQHCPDVKIFHVSEVRSFFSVVGTFFTKSNKIARALYYYCILADIDPNHHTTKRLGDEIIVREFDMFKKKFLARGRTNVFAKKIVFLES